MPMRQLEKGGKIVITVWVALVCALMVGNRIEADQQSAGQQRAREGERVEDLVGTFRVTGDRVTFYPNDSDESFRALENLALERIANALEETTEQRKWTVSGTLTEFRGGNFLLVSRAEIQSRPE